MNILFENAWAQTSSSGGSTFLGFLPLVVIFIVFYFLLIRPQSKKQKEHKEMISSLVVGNEVITAGGILGKNRRNQGAIRPHRNIRGCKGKNTASYHRCIDAKRHNQKRLEDQ